MRTTVLRGSLAVALGVVGCFDKAPVDDGVRKPDAGGVTDLGTVVAGADVTARAQGGSVAVLRRTGQRRQLAASPYH